MWFKTFIRKGGDQTFIIFNIRDKISVTMDMFSKITNTNKMHKNIKQHKKMEKTKVLHARCVEVCHLMALNPASLQENSSRVLEQ